MTSSYNCSKISIKSSARLRTGCVPNPPIRRTAVSHPHHQNPSMANWTCVGGFLFQCTLFFSHTPQSFPDDAAKISHFVGLLRGRALAWAESYLSFHPIDRCRYDYFLDEFKVTFSPPVSEDSAAQKLLALRQGRRSVAEYVVEFRTAAAAVDWPDSALRSIFLRSLNDQMRDQLAFHEETRSFEELLTLSRRIYNCLWEREAEHRSRPFRSASRPEARAVPLLSPLQPTAVAPRSPSPPPPEPMQIGRSWLSPGERERHFRAGDCLYCGGPGHRIADCPVHPNGSAHR